MHPYTPHAHTHMQPRPQAADPYHMQGVKATLRILVFGVMFAVLCTLFCICFCIMIIVAIAVSLSLSI